MRLLEFGGLVENILFVRFVPGAVAAFALASDSIPAPALALALNSGSIPVLVLIGWRCGG